MLGIILGIPVMLLGAKAFTADGLPLTRSKRLTGAKGRIVGAVCIVLGLGFLGGGIHSAASLYQKLQTQKAPADPLAHVTLPMTWRRYDSPEHPFSIDLPAEPTVTRNGEMTMYAAMIGNQEYAVSHSKLDEANPGAETILDEVEKNLAAGMGGKIDKAQDLTVGGHPAREFSIAMPDQTTVRMVVAITDNEMFQVVTAVPNKFATDPVIDKFLNSLEIHDTPRDEAPPANAEEPAADSTVPASDSPVGED